MSELQRHHADCIVVDDGEGGVQVDFQAGQFRPVAHPMESAELRATRGLVDLQVNGFAGVDFNDPALTADALDHALEAMLATGVTVCLPTIITAGRQELSERMEALDAAVESSRLGPIMVPGYHLEGPYLNPAAGYSGCHPAARMTAPSWGAVRELEGRLTRPILLVTLAPELPGGLDFIRQARAAGKLVAIGHSAADFEMAKAAASAGAAMSTHLGNGLPQQLPKLDNTLFAQLGEDRLMASFIADGVHIPPGALKVLLRAKGIQRSVLVTDAVSAAASNPGQYTFAGMKIELSEDRAVRLPGQSNLAGSALCLDQAVRNVVEWELCTPREALVLASLNPLALLGPSLVHHGITLPPSAVSWSEKLVVEEALAGPWRWSR